MEKEIAVVKFLVRQTNGIQRGEIELDEETSILYRSATHSGQIKIRSELCEGASQHFKTKCYVSEIINNQTKTNMEELEERIEEMKKCAIYQVFPKGHRVLVDWERQIAVLQEAYDILEGFRDAEDRYGQDD